MSAEHKKIDVSTWQGPMTVVGYPDFSALKMTTRPSSLKEKSIGQTEVHSVVQKPPITKDHK